MILNQAPQSMTAQEKQAQFEKFANEHYDVEKAKAYLATPVPEGARRWRCVLCGYPQGDFSIDFDDVGAYCCGGCGQSCVRPIEEFREFGEFEDDF